MHLWGSNNINYERNAWGNRTEISAAPGVKLGINISRREISDCYAGSARNKLWETNMALIPNPYSGSIFEAKTYDQEYFIQCVNSDENIDGYLFFKNGLKASIQSLNMKSYDNFDIYIYGSKGLIVIKGIGRDGFIYNVIKSSEHSGFTELDHKPKRIFGPKPRNQFGKLSENAVECMSNKNKKPLCDSYESLVDMIVIDKLLKSSKLNGKKLRIPAPRKTK